MAGWAPFASMGEYCSTCSIPRSALYQPTRHCHHPVLFAVVVSPCHLRCVAQDKAAGELTLRVRTGMAKYESRFVMLLEKPGLPRAQQPASPKSILAALVQPLFGEVGLASIAASGTAPPACAGGATNFVMTQHDYGRYFTKEGYLVRSLLRADLVKLLDKAAWLPAEMRARQQQAARHIQRFFVQAKAQGRLDADVSHPAE